MGKDTPHGKLPACFTNVLWANHGMKLTSHKHIARAHWASDLSHMGDSNRKLGWPKIAKELQNEGQVSLRFAALNDGKVRSLRGGHN